MKTDSEITKQFKIHKKKADRNLGKQRENTKKCRAFKAGDYQEYIDKIQVALSSGQKKRVTVQINKISPYVDAVVGFFAQNRRKPNYLARMEVSKAAMFFSQYGNELSKYCRKSMNADQVETQQDADLITCGIGVVETEYSFGEGFSAKSPNGEIIMGAVDLDTYWYDSACRQTNMTDRRYDCISREFHIDDALDLFEDSKEGDFDDVAPDTLSDYQMQGDLGAYDRIKYDWEDKVEGMVNVHFYQWYDIESYYRADSPVKNLKNPQSMIAAQMELDKIAQEIKDEQDDDADDSNGQNNDGERDEDFDAQSDILSFNASTKARLEESFGEFIEPQEFRRKVFYTAVLSGDKVFKKFKTAHQGFTRKVKTGTYDAKNKIWTGIVNSMMEPQKYYNKFLTELMFIIAANSKGGVIIEEDAVEDIEEFEDQYAKTDVVCTVRPGAISNPNGKKIMDKRSAFQPTGYEQLITLVDASISDVAGLDRSFLGSVENKMESAQLNRQRIRQVSSMLAGYMDSITLYGYEHARLMLDLMRIFAENNRGELFKMSGDHGADQFIQISDDKLAPDFDISVEEAPTTPEERAELAVQISQIADKYMMIPNGEAKASQLYALAAKYANLENSDLQEITKILVPDQNQIDPAQVAQMQEQIKMLTSQMTESQIKNIDAMTKKTLVDAGKSASEIKLNEVKAADLRAGIHKTAADTVKILHDATGKHVDNQFKKKFPHQAMNPKHMNLADHVDAHVKLNPPAKEGKSP